MDLYLLCVAGLFAMALELGFAAHPGMPMALEAATGCVGVLAAVAVALLGGLGPDANQRPGGGIAVVDLSVDAAGPLQTLPCGSPSTTVSARSPSASLCC